MKSLLSIVLLLAFGVSAWGNTPEDFEKLLEKAIAGDSSSQLKVSRAYAQMDRSQWPFIKKDTIKALAWLELAYRNGNYGAWYASQRAGGPLPEVTTKQIIEGKKLAEKLIKKHRYITDRETTFLEKLKDMFLKFNS